MNRNGDLRPPARLPAPVPPRRPRVGAARRRRDGDDRGDPVADRPRDRPNPRRRPSGPAHARVRRARRRRAAHRADGVPAAARGARLARHRGQPARAHVRPPAVARARLLRPPADGPAHVARDGRPAVGALLPRLRARLHPAVGADDPARRRGDDRHPAGAGRDLAGARAARRVRRRPLRPARAPRAAGSPAAHRRAHGRRRGERRRRARRQGVRARGPPARGLPPSRRAGVRPGDGVDAPAGLLQPVHRLPAPGRPGRDPVLRRAPGHPRRAHDRPVQRLLRVPADAALADADARDLARAGPARHGRRRAPVRDPRPRAAHRQPARGAGAAGRQRPRRAARRDARVRGRRAPRPARRLARRARGQDGRAGRRDRLGQDDARAAHPAAVRRHRGRRARRRRGRARRRRGRPARRGRRRRRRPVPVLGDGGREHRLRARRRHARGDRARRPPRAGTRLHRAPAGRLRHPRRRARPDALRRPAPAHRDRPRVPRRPAHPDPRRRDLERRRLHRAGDQGRAARGDGGAHDVRDRPSPVDDLARRRDRGARGRRAARARPPRRAARDLRPVPRDRREGPPRPGVPHPQAGRAQGGGAVTTGAEAARAATRRDDLRRRLRGTGGRGRKLRGLIVLLGPYKLRVAAMFVALVLGTAASLAPAPLAKTAIDSGILKGDERTLNLVVAAFIASALVVWAATFAQTYLVGWVGQRALADLRLQIFRHLQEMPVGFYERRPAGVLISRMTNDVEALDSLVTDTVVTLFQASLTLVGSIVILLVLDVKLALITFLIFPVMAAGSLAFRIASADAYRRTRETIGAITAYLQETLSGIRVVRAFHQEPRHRARFRELNDINRAANMTTVNLNAVYFPGVEFLSSVATVALLLVGGAQVISGDVQVGVLVGFLAALNGFFDPIGQLSQVYTTYQSGMAALDKIFELLDEQPELRDAPDAIDLPRIRGEIRFEDVSFRYGGGDEDGDGGRPKLALDHVTMTIPPGQTVALVGATGAGKSTFAKLVARFYDPSDGRVLVDGHDLRTVRAESLRSQMGIVPQEAFLFSGTVGENIAFGRPGATAEEIEAASHAVGAWDFIAALPDGLDTEVGERAVQLSAGQRQLVAFARALIADPRILVLDEATSNVDLHTEGRIEAGLRRRLAGRTAIVI